MLIAPGGILAPPSGALTPAPPLGSVFGSVAIEVNNNSLDLANLAPDAASLV